MNLASEGDFQKRLKLLERVRVVLVQVKFPGNIGSVARVMKNTGFSDLRLVRPRADLDKEAYQRALFASDILDRAVIHQSLPEALLDCSLVIGTTRRYGVLRRNIISPEEMAEMVCGALEQNNAALVFGNEESGLCNDDLNLCHFTVGIHTGVEHDSFNLSHAAGLILYALNRSLLKQSPAARELADSQSLENMFQHLEQVLLEVGFIKEKDPKRMMTVIRQIFHRAQLSARDVRIIRGILRQVQWKINNPKGDS